MKSTWTSTWSIDPSLSLDILEMPSSSRGLGNDVRLFLKAMLTASMRLRYLIDRIILGSQPMRRWTPEELAAEKAALESLTPEAVQTEAVSMRLTAYLAQRYLPTTDARTEAEWRETQRRIRRKVRRTIAGKPPLEPPHGVDPEFSDWMDRMLKMGKYKDAT
jgi:hypothetical protein